MTTFHAGLTAEHWQEFSLVEQLANVGSEVERAMKWAQKGQPEQSTNALYRGLELIDLTIADPRHRERLKELCRMREVLLDYFIGPNQHGSSDEAWHRYFNYFTMAAAYEREQARVS
jgi:hypothetical protein